jgi:hypothetical protein
VRVVRPPLLEPLLIGSTLLDGGVLTVVPPVECVLGISNGGNRTLLSDVIDRVDGVPALIDEDSERSRRTSVDTHMAVREHSPARFTGPGCFGHSVEPAVEDALARIVLPEVDIFGASDFSVG